MPGWAYRWRRFVAHPTGRESAVVNARSDQAAELMDLLGLTEEELCQTLDVDALTLLSGQIEHRSELPILLDLLGEARERAGEAHDAPG